ncbi:hypothetical protein GOV07_02860, partial [Candidatus Woesearchaeota archaeon]|nr:hypothetical protein [Candidatus Woesearchaeota archaeon]
DVGLNYLIEQGYHKALMMEGWNPEMAAKIDDYLNPEKWKENLCNPHGAYKEFTQDVGAVYAFQDGTYRPVLTFAGEYLELDGYYLYTASGVAMSLEGDNQINLTLMPGHILIGSAELPENTFGSPQGSYNSTVLYEHVCAEFREPFPDPAGSKQYCRPLEQDAYGRGVWTNATLPEYGTDDPYNKNTSSSIAGTQLWGLMGGMMGGMSG